MGGVAAGRQPEYNASMFSEALGIFDSLEIREVIITYFPPAAISFSPIMQTQFIFIHFILVSQIIMQRLPPPA